MKTVQNMFIYWGKNKQTSSSLLLLIVSLRFSSSNLSPTFTFQLTTLFNDQMRHGVLHVCIMASEILLNKTIDKRHIFVRLSVRLYVCKFFTISFFPFTTTWPISTKNGTRHPWRGFKFLQIEDRAYLLGEIIVTANRCFKTCSSPESLG